MTMRILVLALGAAFGLPQQGDGIIRLRPREFRQLPAAVRRNLDTRGCTIPQYPGKQAPHNVITGSFIAKGSRDWAVLCSVNGRSRILVYRNGAAGKVDSLAPLADSGFMQLNASGVREFSRKIEIATPKDIAARAKEYGVPKPPSLDHDGIDDGYMDKASTVLFYTRGKWRELPGAN